MSFDSNNEDAETLKMQGNNYMQDKQYLKAVNAYTKALAKTEDRNVILSNRAEAFIKLGYFLSALKDCEDVLKNENTIDKPILQKVLFRKARALEQLASNKDDLNKVKEIYSKLDTQVNTENLDEKFKNLEGIFNYEKMINYEKECMNIINGKKYYLDSLNKEMKFVSFISDDIELGFSEEKGVHWKAKRDFKPGELIIVEHPIVSTYLAEIKKFNKTFEQFRNMGFTSNEIAIEILYTFIKDRINFDSEKDYIFEKISKLSTLSTTKFNIEKRQKDFKFSDELLKEIISNNAILTTRSEKNKIAPIELCYGLFLNCSFFNHCCLPNCFYFGAANMLIVKAVSDIKSGEELTVSYIEPKPLVLRKGEMEKWEFYCGCKLCQDEVSICERDSYYEVYKAYITIQDIVRKDGIESYESLEDNLSVASQDSIIVTIENLIKKNYIDYEDEKNKFVNFIFFKAAGVILGHFEKYKPFANYLFEKAYESIKRISLRETYSLLTDWSVLCKKEIFYLKLYELNKVIDSYHNILFTI